MYVGLGSQNVGLDAHPFQAQHAADQPIQVGKTGLCGELHDLQDARNCHGAEYLGFVHQLQLVELHLGDGCNRCLFGVVLPGKGPEQGTRVGAAQSRFVLAQHLGRFGNGLSITQVARCRFLRLHGLAGQGNDLAQQH
jgi:hypothetical protein